MESIRMRLILPAFLLLLSPYLRAQSIQPIILDGDTVPGIGVVTAIQGMGVDDSGNVLVCVFTDNVDLLKNSAFVDNSGTPVIQEGQVLADPAGSVIKSFTGGELSMTAAGTPLFYVGFDPPVLTGDEGLYFGTPPTLGVIETGACPASGLPAGFTYSILLPGRINAANDLCFYAILDDPILPGLFNRDVLMVVSPSTGVHTIHAQENEVLPGQSFTTLSFFWETLAFNDAGQIIFGAQTAGPSDSNNVLYLNGTKLAQKGDPSPFGGAFGLVASSTTCADLNDLGDHVFSVGNAGAMAVVRNGEAFVRAGDTLPSIEPFALTEFGQPFFIGNNGRVAWVGQWDVPGPVDRRGLFVDYSLLAEDGVTEIGGLTVLEINALDRGFAMSASGRYVVFEALVTGDREGAFLIDLGS